MVGSTTEITATTTTTGAGFPPRRSSQISSRTSVWQCWGKIRRAPMMCSPLRTTVTSMSRWGPATVQSHQQKCFPLPGAHQWTISPKYYLHVNHHHATDHFYTETAHQGFHDGIHHSYVNNNKFPVSWSGLGAFTYRSCDVQQYSEASLLPRTTGGDSPSTKSTIYNLCITETITNVATCIPHRDTLS